MEVFKKAYSRARAHIRRAEWIQRNFKALIWHVGTVAALLMMIVALKNKEWELAGAYGWAMTLEYIWTESRRPKSVIKVVEV
jgi:hypothetical protein